MSLTLLVPVCSWQRTELMYVRKASYPNKEQIGNVTLLDSSCWLCALWCELLSCARAGDQDLCRVLSMSLGRVQGPGCRHTMVDGVHRVGCEGGGASETVSIRCFQLLPGHRTSNMWSRQLWRQNVSNKADIMQYSFLALSSTCLRF